MTRRISTILIFFALASLAGCTTIEITAGDGSTKIERTFGIVNLELSPNADAMFAETKSIGIVSGPSGVSVGYAIQNVAATSSLCKIVLWIKDKTQLDALREEVGDITGVCLLNNK